MEHIRDVAITALCLLVVLRLIVDLLKGDW